MRKLFTYSFLTSFLLIGTNSAIADQYKYLKGVTLTSPTPAFQIYGITAQGEETLLNTWDGNPDKTTNYFSSFALSSASDDHTSKIVIDITENASTTLVNSYQIEYDVKDNIFTKIPDLDPEISSGQKIIYPKMLEILIKQNADGSVQIGSDTDDVDVVSDGLNIDGAAVITKNSDGSIQVGGDENDIDITAEGLNIDGNPLITQKENGEIHIGNNSLITTKEEKTLSDGTKVQPLYAQDAEGNKIPININGSKLLINGVEITPSGIIPQVTTNKNNISTNTSNIKNLGEGVAGSTALTAALSALPQTSKESKLSCGVGTGAYSSRYAIGFGCASKVNHRVDINAGGSYVFGGSKSYGGGTLDSGVVKAGFVFKLGELKQPIQISSKEKKKMETKIGTLSEKNEKLLNTVLTLMERLERLEKIASRDLK